jgi:hypothetical protein
LEKKGNLFSFLEKKNDDKIKKKVTKSSGKENLEHTIIHSIVFVNDLSPGVYYMMILEMIEWLS